MKGRWFNFGYELGLTVGQLDDIEMRYRDPLQCTRKVLLQWRVNNRSASWEPLTEAFHKIGLNELAVDIEHQFTISQTPEEFEGVYCSLCNEYHHKISSHAKEKIAGKSISLFILMNTLSIHQSCLQFQKLSYKQCLL